MPVFFEFHASVPSGTEVLVEEKKKKTLRSKLGTMDM
jgi:hypothetical protein